MHRTVTADCVQCAWGQCGSDGPPGATLSLGAALTDVTIPSQVGLKLFDNDPKQTRGKRISNLPRQKLIMRDLNFLLS